MLTDETDFRVDTRPRTTIRRPDIAAHLEEVVLLEASSDPETNATAMADLGMTLARVARNTMT